MSLPKLVAPKFSIQLPSTGQVVFYRPFLVKEEKALLIAGETGDIRLQVQAIKDALSACVYDVDISKLPYYDIEYLFLNLRAKSVGEEIRYSYRHRNGINRSGEKCEASTEVAVQLDDIKVQTNPEHTSKFMLDDKYGVIMRHPTIDDVIALSGKDIVETEAIARCIESVFDSETVYPSSTLKEAMDFVEGLNTAQYEKLAKWFDTMPVLRHTFKYTCSGCGEESEVTYEGVSDFF